MASPAATPTEQREQLRQTRGGAEATPEHAGKPPEIEGDLC